MTPLATIDAGPSGAPTGSTADAPPVELRRLPSAADAKSKAEEARQLYPYIRSALEADLRRQLEGKSRASRFRP
jgi:hypothetical protein